jgi:hypothetical protein
MKKKNKNYAKGKKIITIQDKNNHITVSASSLLSMRD